ncbi:MAG TPA: tetratricopeptide repeat protein [Rhizomicrobium sp.]|jgi:tetratricopeptide (TPR) repeat protein
MRCVLAAAVLMFPVFVGLPAKADPANYASLGSFDTCADSRINVDLRIRSCKAFLATGGLAPSDAASGFTNLGLAYWSKGDSGDALESYAMALKLDPSSWRVYVDRADLYVTISKGDLALADCNAGLAIMPDEWELYMCRGAAYHVLDQRDLEFAAYDHAIALHPTGQNYRIRAEAHAYRKELDAALADVEQALKLEPEEMNTLLVLAWAYSAHGDEEKQREVFRKILDIGKNTHITDGVRGLAEFQLGMNDSAIADLTASLKQFPDNKSTYLWRGRAYFHAKKYDLSLADFNAALARDPHSLEGQQLRGITYAHLGDADHALADFDAIAAATPSDWRALSNVCWFRGLFNRELDKAEAACRRGLELSPNNAALLDSLAFLQFRRGQLADAEKTYSAAIAANPRSYQSFYMRGVVRRQTGDTAGGDADIAAGLAGAPDEADEFARYGVPKASAP